MAAVRKLFDLCQTWKNTFFTKFLIFGWKILNEEHIFILVWNWNNRTFLRSSCKDFFCLRGAERMSQKNFNLTVGPNGEVFLPSPICYRDCISAMRSWIVKISYSEANLIVLSWFLLFFCEVDSPVFLPLQYTLLPPRQILQNKLKIAKNRTEFMKKSKICVFQRFWGGGTGTPLQWSLAGVGRHGFQSKNRLLWLFSMVWGLSLLTQFRKAIFGYFKVFFKLLAMWSKV